MSINQKNKVKAIVMTLILSLIIGVAILVTPFNDNTAYLLVSSPIILLFLSISYNIVLDKLKSKDDE